MRFYTRNVKSETRAESDACAYQAAINSDGCITIRGILRGLKGQDSDETMIVLNESETRAIFKLLSVVKDSPFFTDSPF